MTDPSSSLDSRHRLPRKTVYAYALAAVPSGMLGLPLVVYLPTFYASEMGLSLGTVGLIFMLARIWDVVSDPIMGLASDRLNTKWGRRKPGLVLAAPLLMLTSVMVFMPPEGAGVTFVSFWILVLYTAFTIWTISHLSWGAELSPDYHERSRIMGVRHAVILSSMFITLTIPAIIQLPQVGLGGLREGVAAMGWFVIIGVPFVAIIATRLAPEPAIEPRPHVPWRESIAVLLKNGPMRRLVVVDLISNLAAGITGSIYIYFVSAVMQLPDYGNLLLLLYFVASVVGLPLWLHLSYRFGKHRAMGIALFYGALALPLVLILPKGVLWVVALANFAYGLAYGAIEFLPRAIMADVLDKDHVEVGESRAGLYYALLTLTQKLAFALAAGVSFISLDLIGFDQTIGAANDPQGLAGLAVIYTIVPALCLAVSAVLIWRFPLDERAQRALRAEIAKQHSQSDRGDTN